jgi:hypothetical protein
MTEQEIALITTIGDALRSSPMSWDQIPAGMKETVIEIMRPRPSFSEQQRAFLNHWWLAVDEEEVTQINELLPENTVCIPRADFNGGLWISADLFTDAVDEDSRLHNILPYILSLELHYHEDDFWPNQNEEEIL